MICDSRGIHVDPYMLRLIKKIKGDDKIILISDAFVDHGPIPDGDLYEGAYDINFDFSGEIKHWPVVQVWWFARPQEVQDAVAKLLNDYFVSLGYPGSQISFHIFEYESYYEEGNNFA